MAETENHDGLPRPFDVRTIHYLVRLMSRHQLAEIDLHEGDKRIRLRRGPKQVVAEKVAVAPAVAVPTVVAPPATSTPAAVLSAPKDKPSADGKKLHEIKSPTPGTFYAASNPDTPPFVKVGSKVKPDTVVCIIEAMKVFTDIPAGVSGTITEVLVKNGQSVEFGQPLFRVNPT